MIDTDKYEGHSEGEWKVGARKGAMTVRDSNGEEIAATNSYSNARIMADSPLLLEEVKRLRKDIVSILGAIDLPDYDEFPNTQEELKQMMLDYGQEHLIAEGY